MAQAREVEPPTTPQQYAGELLMEACRNVFDSEYTPEVTPADSQFGDFATNIAMQLRQQLSRNPRDIAQSIAEELGKTNDIASAEVAGPGFVNITFTSEYWLGVAEQMPELIQPRENKKQKVQVEFISANPTGPLTLGNARGGFIGDVLSSVLEHQGHTVTREYYFNDAGTQIRKLIEAVKIAAGVNEGEPEYRGEYINDLTGLVSEEEQPDDERLAEIIPRFILNHQIKPVLERMNIHFDEWFQESSLPQSNAFYSMKQALQERGLIEERDGAIWLKSTEFGDERDRVLIKSNGDITYLGNDIAYHLDIFANRGFDRSIKIWGADHAGQVPSLRLTMDQLCPDKGLDFVIVQWVRLMKEGQEFKISKRAGTYVTVDELMERVGTDVSRWFMLSRSADKHVDFDLDLAAEQSQKNPFWYVMYAYVRAQAIQREASEREINPANTITTLNETEHAMVKKLSRLPDLLNEIERSYEVHHLTFYGRELAKLFHDWYETVRVVELPEEEAAEKLLFLERFSTVMRQYFSILGIEPYEKM